MKRLDNKLDCKSCGTIYLDVPENVNGDTVINCSSCNEPLGTWGELQRDFYQQSEQGVFHLHDWQIDSLTPSDVAKLERDAVQGIEQAPAAIEDC